MLFVRNRLVPLGGVLVIFTAPTGRLIVAYSITL
jgi:hypothetical protein